MRVDTTRSRNGYRPYHARKYDDRLKLRTDHVDEYHSPHILQKPRHHYHDEEYSSAAGIGTGRSNYPSTRFDRQTNNRDIYSPLLTDQVDLSGGLPPTASYYNSSSSSASSTRDRNLPSHYIDSECSRYPSSSSSSTYRRDSPSLPALPSSSSTASSSSYRDDYIPRSNCTDLYIHDEYRSPTLVSRRSPVDTYNDMYQSSDYNNRSERYDITPNRTGSSRDYATGSQPSSVYRSDAYRTSISIPLSSSPPLASSYAPRDQYVQALPSVREVTYRSRPYGMTTSIDHHHQQQSITSNKSSDRHYDDVYHSTSSYRKRWRSNFHENGSKRLMRR